MANEQKMIPFTELATADLFVDAVYESAGSKIADDPLPRLLQVSNMGGFRYRGALADLELVVLTSTLSDPDWPDELDRETGVFTYYGAGNLATEVQSACAGPIALFHLGCFT
jgi:hypothetical protein